MTAGLTAAAVVQAAASPDWDELAECESGGNWSINTGNGYHGGIQFSDQTWDAYGGGQYASTADQASREQQIAIGRRVLAGQGPGAWPACSASTAWLNGGGSGYHRGKRPAGQQVAPAAVEAEHSVQPASKSITASHRAVPTLGVSKVAPAGGSLWTVAVGDTLTSIGARKGVDWQKIYALNRDVVEHPDWIFPGEVLAIPAPSH